MSSLAEAQAIQRHRIAQLREQCTYLPWEHPALTLEIGCGHGHFLAAYAADHPDERCIAIDISNARLVKARRKSDRAGLTNVNWLLASSDNFLAALPADARFTRHVFALFPDPWPKRRHWKNRLIQIQFLNRLASCATPGTRLCFRTDFARYFEEAAAVIRAHPDWTVRPDVPWPYERQTVFEARAKSYQSVVAERV